MHFQIAQLSWPSRESRGPQATDVLEGELPDGMCRICDATVIYLSQECGNRLFQESAETWRCPSCAVQN
jgi:hypothetical protein